MNKKITCAIFLLGITSISGQIILLRELFTSFYGNELSIGIVLAVWLLGGALGSWIFAKFIGAKKEPQYSIYSFSQIALGLFIPVSVIFARISRTFFAVGPGEIAGFPVFLISSLATIAPVTVILGMQFVTGCQMIRASSPSASIGRVYTTEALGAAIGGFATSLFLVQLLGSLDIAIILSSLNFLSAFFMSGACGGARKNAFSSLSAFLVLAAAGFVLFKGPESLDRKSFEYSWRPFGVLETRDSVYGRTTVTQRGNQLNFFNNGLFLFSSNDPLTAEEAVHFVMASSPNPEKVLLIGGGAGEVTDEVLKYPVKSVDYAELDPAIINVSQKFLSHRPFYRLGDTRVNVKNEDGRYLIKNTQDSYDVIIMNLPNPYTAQVNRFYTEEFFAEARRALSDSGVLGFAVSSSENYLGKEQALFLKTLFETALAAFADVKIIPGDTAHFLLAKRKNMLITDPEKIASRMESLGVKALYVNRSYLFSKLSSERLDSLGEALRRAGETRKNRDFFPISYFYDMALWSAYQNLAFSHFFIIFNSRRVLLGAFIFLMLALFTLLLRRKAAGFKEEAVLFALGATGLSEISFEILIVLAFQIIYGYLYYQIGLIVTAFMMGLFVGSRYITKRLDAISAPLGLYIRVQVAVLIYPLLLLVAFGLFSSLYAHAWRPVGPTVFSLLPFVAGFVGGLQYPLANKICLGDKGAAAKTAGKTYAVDLVGSCGGALLVSAFLVPIIGMALTSWLVIALNAVALIGLLLAYGYHDWRY